MIAHEGVALCWAIGVGDVDPDGLVADRRDVAAAGDDLRACVGELLSTNGGTDQPTSIWPLITCVSVPGAPLVATSYGVACSW